MLKSWSIQNFKPILDSGELQFKPVTILAGRNSSGKSSLIQSILMVAQTLADSSPEPALNPLGNIVQLGTLDDILCEFSDSRTIAIRFELSYEVGNRGIYDKWTHKFIGIFDVGERGKSFSAIEGPEATLQSLSLKSDYVRDSVLDEIPDEDIEELFPRESFTDEDRISNYLSQSFSFAHFDWYNPKTAQVEKGPLKDAMNAWVYYLKVANEVTTEEAGRLGVAWKVVIKPGQPSRTLPEIGGGFNHLLPILVMGLLSPKHTLLIIEEPEVTLHPGVQASLGDFFMGLAQCGKQCLIETHSENLVSQLRYHIVQAGGMDKSDCMIYFVDQDERGAAKFEPVQISPQGNILNWPDGFFDETMLQEDKITRASLKKRAKKANNG